MPLGLLHDMCREPLRQIAADMCADKPKARKAA